jgi:hypothetical protein
MDKMREFDFLVGEWDLTYTVPKSPFSEEASGKGTGRFNRALNDKYVVFDYEASFSTGDKAAAHGIFAWDESIKMYRYWWFENSGSFDSSTCNFIDDKTLFMTWHNSNLFQTIKMIDENTLELMMEYPKSRGKFELIMEVIFRKK